MSVLRTVAAVAVITILSSCGDDAAVPTVETTTLASDTTTTSVTTTLNDTTTTGVDPTTTVEETEQPAIWPAADVVFETPEEAAKDFVTQVLGVPPRLGEFQAGDARSGEMAVLAPVETDVGPPAIRSTLVLRQLGDELGWFVLAAVDENESITAPESMSEVAAGPLTIEGLGRGFEGLVVVEAFVAGAATPLDQATAQGGSAEPSEPFSASVDLSGAAPGDVVLLLVRGGVGLETDTGEFSAIPVVIAG